jgi:hypothetical protein
MHWYAVATTLLLQFGSTYYNQHCIPWFTRMPYTLFIYPVDRVSIGSKRRCFRVAIELKLLKMNGILVHMVLLLPSSDKKGSMDSKNAAVAFRRVALACTLGAILEAIYGVTWGAISGTGFGSLFGCILTYSNRPQKKYFNVCYHPNVT